MLEELKPFYYDRSLSMWMEAPSASPAVRLDTLSIVTFNVWFWHRHFYERLDALLRIVESCDADVIAFQEVTPEFLEAVLEIDWIRKRYWLSDALGETVSPYGVLLLSRLPAHALTLHDLPSMMGRKLLTADFVFNEERFQVATVHLESTRKMAELRADQLERIQPLLRSSEHAVLMGDFNFCSSWSEECENLEPDFHDLWPLLRPHDAGYTVDTEANLMRREEMQETKRVRFDRILFRTSTPGWTPSSIELLGTRPISEAASTVFPSDHFGLLAVFRRVPAPTGLG